MSGTDIADTIAAFSRTAAEAKRLGFDVVEIHGARGWLIDEIFWFATNLRTDRFGGSMIKERPRFAAEIVRSVCAAVGEDYPITLRVSQWKPQDYSSWPASRQHDRLLITPFEYQDRPTPTQVGNLNATQILSVIQDPGERNRPRTLATISAA